jgi:hypothetical protein
LPLERKEGREEGKKKAEGRVVPVQALFLGKLVSREAILRWSLKSPKSCPTRLVCRNMLVEEINGERSIRA